MANGESLLALRRLKLAVDQGGAAVKDNQLSVFYHRSAVLYAAEPVALTLSATTHLMLRLAFDVDF